MNRLLVLCLALAVSPVAGCKKKEKKRNPNHEHAAETQAPIKDLQSELKEDPVTDPVVSQSETSLVKSNTAIAKDYNASIDSRVAAIETLIPYANRYASVKTAAVAIGKDPKTTDQKLMRAIIKLFKGAKLGSPSIVETTLAIYNKADAETKLSASAQLAFMGQANPKVGTPSFFLANYNAAMKLINSSDFVKNVTEKATVDNLLSTLISTGQFERAGAEYLFYGLSGGNYSMEYGQGYIPTIKPNDTSIAGNVFEYATMKYIKQMGYDNYDTDDVSYMSEDAAWLVGKLDSNLGISNAASSLATSCHNLFSYITGY